MVSDYEFAHNDHGARHWDRTCPACAASSLRAELAAKELRPPKHQTELVRTHWVGCETAHLDCALLLLEKVRAELAAAQKRLADIDRLPELDQAKADAEITTAIRYGSVQRALMGLDSLKTYTMRLRISKEKAEAKLAAAKTLLTEALTAIEEIRTDKCSAWCGYRELRARLKTTIDAAKESNKC